MDGQDKIGEIRGIAPNQNMDPYIMPALEEKLKEFGSEGELYKKRVEDMKTLTGIWERNRNEEILNTSDLRFLYEIDKKINGFGYNEDPRIKEILSRRDIKRCPTIPVAPTIPTLYFFIDILPPDEKYKLIYYILSR
jgi:hypothetical protein